MQSYIDIFVWFGALFNHFSLTITTLYYLHCSIFELHFLNIRKKKVTAKSSLGIKC